MVKSRRAACRSGRNGGAAVNDVQEYFRKITKRLHEHCDRFEIARPEQEDAGGWYLLALNLLIEREPSLSPVPDKLGRRPSVDGWRDIVIYHALRSAEEEKANTGSSKGQNWAARKLEKRLGIKASTISKRYRILQDPHSQEGQKLRTMIAYLAQKEREEEQRENGA